MPPTVAVLADWLLTAHRAAIHRPTGSAVIADLHLGYDRARQRSGEAVPASSFAETIAALAPLVALPEVRRLVVAGDLIENRAGAPLVAPWIEWLAGAGVELVAVVPGNHDRGLATQLALPIYPEGFRVGAWRIVHGDRPAARGALVLGHFHPCLRWRGAAAPCFLVGKRHLLLPAFSADAAGVNVLGDPRWQSDRCFAIVGAEVLDFGSMATLRAHRRARNEKGAKQ